LMRRWRLGKYGNNSKSDFIAGTIRTCYLWGHVVQQVIWSASGSRQAATTRSGRRWTLHMMVKRKVAKSGAIAL